MMAHHRVTGEPVDHFPPDVPTAWLLPVPPSVLERNDTSATVLNKVDIFTEQLAYEHADQHGQPYAHPFCPVCRPGLLGKMSLCRMLMLDPRFDPTTVDCTEGNGGGPITFGRPSRASAEPVPDLIDGVIPTASIGFLLGQPSSLKSFVAIAMSMASTVGLPWFGRATDMPRPSMYMPGEGQAGLDPRFHAAADELGLAEDYLGTGDLIRADTTPNLVTGGRNLEDTLAALRGQEYRDRWGLVVIDTLSTAAEGAAQNDDTDMSVLMGNARRIRRAGGPGCSVLIVSHPTKSGSDLLAGSRVLRGGADFAISVERSGMHITLKHEKHPKDGEPMQALTLRGVPVDSTLILRLASPDDAVTEDATIRTRLTSLLNAKSHLDPFTGPQLLGILNEPQFNKPASKSATYDALDKLVEQGVVVKIEAGRTSRYKLHTDHIVKGF